MERHIFLEGERNPGEKVKVMEAEIRQLPETRVLFVRRVGPYGEAAAGAWEALMKFAYSRRLMTGETRLIGISHDDPSITPEEMIRYDACVTLGGE
ncbi:GyrI-like domain-containing protein [Geobacter sp.]|uniref:GyrI-like domain-containing protein n=1 Tax=Geobacter sp. TaxID=46610 RepID=UPI0026311F5F|nr:GyrI-like domain-containing protein [Geobacter sp.]